MIHAHCLALKSTPLAARPGASGFRHTASDDIDLPVLAARAALVELGPLLNSLVDDRRAFSSGEGGASDRHTALGIVPLNGASDPCERRDQTATVCPGMGRVLASVEHSKEPS